MKITNSSTTLLILLAALRFTPALAAQTDSQPLVELEPFIVLGADSPWGTGDGLSGAGLVLGGSGAESGRAWSLVTAEDLQSGGAARLEHVFWQVAGAGSPARFGVVTVPNLRGDAAETLLNGQRRGDNLFGLPPSMTLIESIEIVKGPPLVRTGPGKRTGGLANLSSRKARLGTQAGSIDIRLGTWVPGGESYGTLEATFDMNQPLGKDQALRLATGWRDDATAYAANGGRDDNRDILISWHRAGPADSRLDALVYYQRSDRPQTLGVNRPWQGLIDDGLYVTGGVDALIGQSNPPGPLDPGIVDPGLITGGPADLISLPADRVLLSQGDIGRGEALLGQIIWSRPLAGGLVFEQSVLAETVSREKFHAFLYAEDVDQETYDSVSRLSGGQEWGPGFLHWEIGLHLRQEDRDNRTNYWNEFAYAFDITTGRQFDARTAFGDYLAPGALTAADGRQWYVPSSPFSTPESSQSRLRQAGVYAQARQTLGNSWSFSAGVRTDHFRVEAAEPADLVPVDAWSDAAEENLASFTLTLRQDGERFYHYTTFGQHRGVAGNTVGDGINLHAPGQLHADDFRNRSRILEWGGGWRPGPAIQARWALFQQERSRPEFFGPADLRVRGFELETEAAINDSSLLTATFTLLDARYDQSAPAEFGGGSLWNVYAPGAGPSGEGNGLGYIGGFFLNSQESGDHRLPGLSRWTASLGLRHYVTRKWILQVWGTLQGRQTGNLAGEYSIPSQMEWNAALTYTVESWECQLVVRNLLDADNWSHNGDTFFDQMLVSRNEPIRFEGRLRLRF